MPKASDKPFNTLYYGDNLNVLRDYIDDESVDLIYLDPPFNSNANYNVLFAERDGTEAAAQIKAFEDTWRWDAAAAEAYHEAVQSGHGRVPDAMRGFKAMLGESDMLAYISMMAPRLIELHRVLKPTGSIYLHCDPTASHYLKMLMDAVFGPQNFKNEIIWKRTSAHSSAKRFGPVHDAIYFYTKGKEYIWNRVFQPYDPEYLETFFDMTDSKGRRWKRMDLTGAGIRHGETGKSWRGIDVTAKGRHWANPPAVLEKLDAAGKIHWPQKVGGMPRLKQYPEDLSGVPAQDVITDCRPIHNLSTERLGYPTQKPEALLGRIINASSNEGDVVLDPFCGCGTAVAVAQKLNRRWIGIDVTHLAINLIKHRLFDSFTVKEEHDYRVVGEPESLSGAKQLAQEDRFQFQAWALGLVRARVSSSAKRGADKGIDGRLFFHDDPDHKTETKQVILQVKSGKISARDVRDLRGVLGREAEGGAVIGVLVTLQPSTAPMRKEAASAGIYDSPWGTKHARLQILTVEGLLKGSEQIGMPATGDHRTFKKAPKAKRGKNDQAELF